MAEVKVIGAPASLTCARVEWALRIKGVEYEYIAEDLLNKSPVLLEMNPVHKKVPVLVHNGNPIAESLVIIEYIDETWKKNCLMPEDPLERASARFWAKYADEKCLPRVFEAVQAEGKEKQKAIKSAQELLAFVEKQIEGKKFFGKEKIGFLDLALGWMSLWLSAMEEVGGMKVLDPTQFPSLCEWAENFIKDPFIRDNMPPREDVVNYFQGGLDYLRSLAVKQT